MMRYLFYILLFISFQSFGQGVKQKFGVVRAIDTAYDIGSIQVDSNVKFKSLASDDTNTVLGVDASGNVRKRTKGVSQIYNYYGTIIHGGDSIEVDSSKFQVKLNYTPEDVANKIGTGGAPSSTTYYHASAINTFNSTIYTSIADSVLGRVKYTDSLTIYATPKNVKDSVSGRQKYSDTTTWDATKAFVAANYVPYSGATSNLNLGDHNLFSTGSLGVGTTSPVTPVEVVETSTVTPRGFTNTQYSNTTSSAQVHLRKSRGTPSAPLTVAAGDVIGRVMYEGYDGSNFLTMADIRAVVTGSVTTTRVPMYLGFYTATDATPSVMTERMRINSDGSVSYFGSTSGSYTFLAPAAVTSYTITPPSAVGTSGQVQNISSVSGNAISMDWLTPVRTSLNQTWTKSQAGAISILTYSTTLTPDFSLSNNYECTLTGSVTLGTPTSITEGQPVTIALYQDTTGSRLLSSSSWPWCWQGGLLPTLSTTGTKKDVVQGVVTRYRTATVTISAAFPAVVTWTNHGLIDGMKVQFTTSGSLPTGLSASTTYWVIRPTTNTFQLASSFNSRTAVSTSGGSQSGVHTGTCIQIDANVINDSR